MVEANFHARFWKKDLRHAIFRWLQIQREMDCGKKFNLPGYRRIMSALWDLLRPHGDVCSQFQGFKLILPGQDTVMTPMMLVHGVHEEAETELLRRELREGKTFVDIGANIGYFSLLASSLVGLQGKVFAFEPEPESYRFLCENIRLNHAQNVIPFQKAVSRNNGKTKFFLDEGNRGGHTMASKNIQTQKKGEIEVETVTLDDFYENAGGAIHFIKVDAQGAEGLIFEGMNKILTLPNLKMLIEFWPAGLRALGTDPLKFLNRLSLNFEIQIFDFKKKDFCASTPSEVMKRIEAQSYLNLFCKKK